MSRNVTSKPKKSKDAIHKPPEPSKKGGDHSPPVSEKKDNYKPTAQPVTRECPLSSDDGGHVPVKEAGKEGHTVFTHSANIGHGPPMHQLLLLDFICLRISTILPFASRPFFKT